MRSQNVGKHEAKRILRERLAARMRTYFAAMMDGIVLQYAGTIVTARPSPRTPVAPSPAS
jgi:hypothetical protein